MLINVAGQMQCDLSLQPNRPEGELFSNIAFNAARGISEIDRAEPATDVPAVIVGGGPSVKASLEKIRKMKDAGASVFALNNAAHFLYLNGIVADYQVIIDSRIENEQFVAFQWAAQALLSSQCAPCVIDRCLAIGFPVRLWHPAVPNIDKHTGRDAPFAVWSGWTVGLSAMCLAHTMGHREMHLFGYDSCHSEEGKSHAYEQKMNDADEMLKVAIDNRVFNCSVVMAAQASHFEEVVTMLAEHGAAISVHGEGLIPFIAQKMTVAQSAFLAVYDLGASPPSYDFLTFLSQAEKAREAAGKKHLDITFMPGPVKGFRNDDLPPDWQEREAMLWRICVGLTRCLPSVRNVGVLRERQDLDADFPAGWDNVRPLRHYASSYFKESTPILQATEAGKRAAERITGGNQYVTITMRQAAYNAWRNSNEQTWAEVGDWFVDRGYKVIVIPDTNGFASERHATCWEAAFDIDVRLALYQGAHFNCGLMGGPMTMLILQESRFIGFLPYQDGYASNPITMGAYGATDHEERYANGIIVWGGDARDFVFERLQRFYFETPNYLGE